VFEECIEAIHYPERFAERRKRPLLEDREGAKAPYITLEERLDMLEKHAELMMNWKGEERGLIELRKHGVQYLKGLQSAKAFKTQFLTIRTFDALQQLFDTIREQLSRQPEMAGATQPQQTDVAG
jgi:tRNA-dihydrouridine synthase